MQTNRQIDNVKQTDRQTYIQKDRQCKTDRQTDIHTDRQTNREKETDRQTDGITVRTQKLCTLRVFALINSVLSTKQKKLHFRPKIS